MILPDVNVLIYAFRQGVPQHEVCRRWLDRVVGDETRFGISPLALAAVVRITTNARTYAPPAPRSRLPLGYCDNLLGSPIARSSNRAERHFEIFKRLCVETSTRGPRVTDAWYAALAIEWGCEWVTLDRDYARFPGLKFSAPTA